MHDLYPSKAALDEAVESGSTGGASEQLEELAALLVTLVEEGRPDAARAREPQGCGEEGAARGDHAGAEVKLPTRD
jgi:hypothetical protein